ncbi:MAG TPA: alpha/beta hydrolase [Pseudolabrys sp.]|nr:alpha/beta hydrolase [Pseudolabrys sp.]
MTLLKWLLVAVIGGYVGFMLLLFLLQRSMMYPAPAVPRIAPAQVGLPEAEEVILDTQDGEQVIAWHVPPKHGKPVVLFFHGNGEVLPWRVPRFRALIEDGTGLLALSFRGYGGSSGTPSEAGLLADGEAVYAYAAARYPPERIALWGYSLGSGVAVALAAEKPIGALILEAPYTSIADLAVTMFPYVPVRWFVRDPFHSDERIAKVTAPLLVMHGEKDTVIAIHFGEKLFALAPGRKRLIRFPEGTHVNLDEQGAVAAVHAFLGELMQ